MSETRFSGKAGPTISGYAERCSLRAKFKETVQQILTISCSGARNSPRPLNSVLSVEIKMRRMVYFLFVIAALLAGCTTQSKMTDDDLVFLGTVEKLDASPLQQSELDWVVKCRVDKILAGEFSGKAFSFRIHSPSKSGLEVGKQYKIEAKQTDDGYTVDQYQWMERTLNKLDAGDGK